MRQVKRAGRGLPTGEMLPTIDWLVPLKSALDQLPNSNLPEIFSLACLLCIGPGPQVFPARS
jgi:hypothetical protein